jgi:hypothetical protein
MASVLDSSQVKLAGLAVAKPRHMINHASQTALRPVLKVGADVRKL